MIVHIIYSMELNGLTELNILLKLYFSKYAKQEAYGTVADISAEIGNSNGYTRKFIKNLAKDNVLVEGHKIEYKGKFHQTYYVDKEKLTDFLTHLKEFKKIYMIIWDNVVMLHPEMYGKEELNEMKGWVNS